MKTTGSSLKQLIAIALLLISVREYAYAQSCVDRPSGLVSWWRAEGTGDDETGNNNGTLQGATCVPGLVGQAFSISPGNYVSVPDSPSLTPTAAITVECWINRTDWADYFDPVIKKAGGSGGSQDNGYSLEFSGDTLNFWIFNNGDYFGWSYTDGAVLELGQWYHVAGVYDGQYLRLYVNGVEQGTTTITSGAIVPSTNPLRIGNDPANPTSRFFNGLVDEPSIYNRALSATEIQAIYNAGSAGKCPPCTPAPTGLVSWWRAEGDATDANRNNHGTLVGVNCVPGFVGSAFDLQGSANSYVNVPDSPSLTPTAAITVECWINRAGWAGYFDPVIKKAGGSGGAQGNGYSLEFSGDMLNFWIFNNGDYFGWSYTDGAVLELGQWYHVAGVYDGQHLRLYVNGVEQGTTTITSGAIVPSTNPLRIGNDPANPTSRFFNGLVDEASIYSRALSATEIQAIYHAGRTGKCDISQAWTETGSLHFGRFWHTSTLLPNGKVLIAGGAAVNQGAGLTAAELYDPAVGTCALTGPMLLGRYWHTATLLPNGKVLVAAGTANGHDGSASAVLYNPATGTWAVTGSLPVRRYWHTATLLANGKVLVAGGVNGGTLATANLYDPTTGTWTTTGSMNVARMFHTATLLPNGKVLVAGGGNGLPFNTAELYDPATGTWTPTGSLTTGRNWHTATLLANGKVLVAGGEITGGVAISSSELYDTATGVWTPTGSMVDTRKYHTTTLLADGRVLAAGGSGAGFGHAELYDPSTATWTATGALFNGRYFHTATLLSNGKVLAAGGTFLGNTGISSTELYNP